MSFINDVEFILLLDEMKKIERRTKVLGVDRRENDAEHAWHIATMAMFLEKYSKDDLDINKVIKMLLVHDLVEIFAGDTFAYDVSANQDKTLREKESMVKLKSYLDTKMGNVLEALWLEFEDMSTNESVFANSMDRLQPLLLNIFSGKGGTWVEGGVKLSQVLKRAEPIKNLQPEVYEFVYSKILENVKRGYIINE